MSTPISSTTPSVCDPNLASCQSASPAVAATAAVVDSPVVSIEPVVVTGDAGAQALLRRYDESKACRPEWQAAALACPAIALGVLNALEGGPLTGLASAFHASINCGKELRALSDCRDDAEVLRSNAEQVVADCHDRGGAVSPGASSNEIICEVAP
jgi:hypothetical protein